MESRDSFYLLVVAMHYFMYAVQSNLLQHILRLSVKFLHVIPDLHPTGCCLQVLSQVVPWLVTTGAHIFQMAKLAGKS